jgi:hypothetical protein
MTFTFTETHRIHDGNVVIVYGNYANDSNSEGGEIAVRDISFILGASLQPTGAAVKNDASVVDETMLGLPPKINGNAFTIVTTANEAGQWIVTGI